MQRLSLDVGCLDKTCSVEVHSEAYAIIQYIPNSEVGTMQSTNVKQEAYRLLEKLPDDATWDDLMYQIYVRQAIEAGLEDSEAGRYIDVKEVRARFGLPK